MGALILDEKTFTTLLIVLVIAGIIFLIRTIFRFIKWFLCSIWCLLTGKRRRKNPLESDDWLTRAQARQEIRFRNSLPQVLASEMEPEGKQKKKKRQSGKEPTWYPSGWVRNKRTGMWDPPDYLEKESKSRWKWDAEKQIWIDLSKETATKKGNMHQPKESGVRWKWVPEKNIWVDTQEKK